MANAAPAPATSFDAKLTLELQGVDILDVLKILSKKSGLNIVAGKNVQGTVSIFLRDVPVMEALKTILQSQGLASVKEENIIKIIPEEEYFKKYGEPFGDTRSSMTFQLKYAQSDLLAAKLAELKSVNGKIFNDKRTNSLMVREIPKILADMEAMITEWDQPQETVVFAIRYAPTKDLKETLKPFVEEGTGKIEIDTRSNSLIVVDIPSRIEKLRDIINSLDVPVLQVLIEAKIVEVRLNDNYRRGIDWQKVFASINDIDLKAAAPLLVTPPAGASALSTLAISSTKNNLNIVISALEQIGKTNLLSSPRITVLNEQEARLAVATREPFVSQTVIQTQTSTNTADNVQFIDVGVTMKVKPRILQDGFLELKIRPEVSSSNKTVELQGVASASNTTYTRTVIPVVTTQELETTVLVHSGTTIVIGGLIQDKQSKATVKVPIIGSIPWIGNLFQSRSHDFEKTELVTFLTPIILDPKLPTNELQKYEDSKGRIKPFDEVGGYPFRRNYTEPLRYAKEGDIPYWKDVHDKDSRS
ncbi:MAG: secretin N-terminal domain-containing protein [Candidatus Omnitrophota bacterium]|jgi:type II secretory pathway component GspD/PulD (secretin)